MTMATSVLSTSIGVLTTEFANQIGQASSARRRKTLLRNLQYNQTTIQRLNRKTETDNIPELPLSSAQSTLTSLLVPKVVLALSIPASLALQLIATTLKPQITVILAQTTVVHLVSREFLVGKERF